MGLIGARNTAVGICYGQIGYLHSCTRRYEGAAVGKS